jgi:RNA polymerase sigma factor (sigma-70 family)
MVESEDISIQKARPLPDYTSPTFWQAVQTPDMPLEVLVRVLRIANARGDEQTRNRLLETVLLRIQTASESWAHSVLKNIAVPADERNALMDDLCADLYEHILRALLDPKRLFWEENFAHCLSFERKHVYRSLMTREGRWHDLHVKRSARIPRSLMARLDQTIELVDGEDCPVDIEDERAQMMLRTVDYSDLLQLVLHLPDRHKAVVLLIFWEGRTEKETAQILGISDRTVRNRIQAALKLLRGILVVEGECVGYD